MAVTSVYGAQLRSRLIQIKTYWHFRTTIWRTRARLHARGDLDSINDWVRNLRHVPFGGQTHDRYNVDIAITPHSDHYDDGGC